MIKTELATIYDHYKQSAYWYIILLPIMLLYNMLLYIILFIYVMVGITFYVIIAMCIHILV